MNPEELGSRYQLTFNRELDDLDFSDVARLQLPSSRLLVLARYRGEVDPGTAVEADYNDNGFEARKELLEVLQLPPDSFVWTEAS